MPRKGEEKRGRIVESANRLFYERGFHATSLADIADTSSIPKGNFYFYFKTKDDILQAVLDARLARLEGLLASWLDEHPTPLDRLKRLIQMPLRDWTEISRYGCPIGTLTAELGKQDDRLDALAVRMFDLLIDWAAARFTEMGLCDDAGPRARRLIARLQGAVTLAQAYRDRSWITEEVAAVERDLQAVAHAQSQSATLK